MVRCKETISHSGRCPPSRGCMGGAPAAGASGTQLRNPGPPNGPIPSGYALTPLQRELCEGNHRSDSNRWCATVGPVGLRAVTVKGPLDSVSEDIQRWLQTSQTSKRLRYSNSLVHSGPVESVPPIPQHQDDVHAARGTQAYGHRPLQDAAVKQVPGTLPSCQRAAAASERCPCWAFPPLAANSGYDSLDGHP